MSDYDPNYREAPVWAKVGGKIVVTNTKGEVLFLRRSAKSTRPHGWDLPGGGLDHGEDAYEGIKRETREEAQLDVTDITPVHVSSSITEGGAFLVMIGYMGIVTEEKDPVLSWEHESYRWVSKEEALQIPLPEFHAETVKKALK